MENIFTEKTETRKIIERTVFSILYHDKDKNIIKHIGTGFLVCKNGLFITAGHVFRDRLNLTLDDLRACFIINDVPHILNIKHIIFKSIHKNNQKSPEFKDYAIGQIDFKNSYYLNMKKMRPKYMQSLTSWAYEYKEEGLEPSLGTDFNYLDLNKIHLKDREYFYRKDTICIPPTETFNNCSSLRGVAKHTNSGGPIIDEYLFVAGIIVSKVEGIQGQDIDGEFIIMLRSKYCIRRITYDTPFKYKIKNCASLKYIVRNNV